MRCATGYGHSASGFLESNSPKVLLVVTGAKSDGPSATIFAGLASRRNALHQGTIHFELRVKSPVRCGFNPVRRESRMETSCQNRVTLPVAGPVLIPTKNS